MFIHEYIFQHMMSSSYVSGVGRNQLHFMPDMIEDYIEEDNAARFIDFFFDSLDLLKLGFTHCTLEAGADRTSYTLCDMLKLYLRGYCNGLMSSRKHENECKCNL